MQEDCLLLKVFTPADVETGQFDELLPVMVEQKSINIVLKNG